MESENGVKVEDDSTVIAALQMEGSTLELKEEDLKLDKGEEGLNVDVTCEQAAKFEGRNSAKTATEAVGIVSESKISKPLKEKIGKTAKDSKMAKNKSDLKGPASFSRNQMPVLSQSLSFPSKGARADVLKKSVDMYPGKANAKQVQANGTKAQSNGPVSREVKPNVNGVPARRATLASMPSIQRVAPTKTDSVNAAADSPPPKASLSASKYATTALSSKEDDDNHSTTSGTTPQCRKSAGSGFSFRLNERAEKRKEFFAKLEEKIQAKEAEKTNLQAKSKENQEAEIKQLRKSLTFKATPMPSFYKEPAPKVELKKIPTTRAVSPKLGRNKSSTAATNGSSEGDGSPQSPQLKQDEHNNSTKTIQTNGNKITNPSKKPIRKSLSRLQNPNSTTPRNEGKPVKSKPNSSGAESQSQNLEEQTTIVEKTEENQTQCVHHPLECENGVDVVPENRLVQGDEPISTLPNPEVMPREVAVGG